MDYGITKTRRSTRMNLDKSEILKFRIAASIDDENFQFFTDLLNSKAPIRFGEIDYIVTEQKQKGSNIWFYFKKLEL
jgi:hypothetical protein